VRPEAGDEIAGFLASDLHSRDEVLAAPSVVPAQPGVYGWWFRDLPSPAIDTAGCCRRRGFTLLYVGISPYPPPASGRAASRQNLRKRIRQHYSRTAAASTLRRSLGCLLAAQLGIGLQLASTSGRRTNFGTGEQLLSQWMAANAYVGWLVREHPWELEERLIGSLDLPLNLRGNQRNPFCPVLTAARARCLDHARRASASSD
jgi:hypothetical protein